ncbi:MAG: 4Fe-4S dicluster domain-containing protein [Clostridiales bacterium]|nr:4Fe-4S dicluster domain-containing protein [Clostridiales bacterium]
MGKVNITIDGCQMQVEDNLTVLEAARQAGIEIPTLCYLKDLNKIGACRICLVEVQGARGLQASCSYPVSEGMVVRTNTKQVREARKATLELLLSTHKKNCLSCSRNTDCELQALAEQMGVGEVIYDEDEMDDEIDNLSTSIVRDSSKCILCRRCVAVCKNVQSVGAIDVAYRGIESKITPAFDKSLADSNCVNCGQCVAVCPVGALSIKYDIDRVWEALSNDDVHVVVQTAPAVRAALGEEFGMEIGTATTGKMVSALRRLGFNKVFDTDTGADFTIMEEGTEFINRLKENKNLPLITSCSPGWVKFAEHNFPELLDNLSTAKSPMSMFGALIKTYYAKQEGIDPSKIFSVAVMPCTAKKFECDRPEMNDSGYQDVDAVITTVELAKMIKQAGINFEKLPDEQFDSPMGEATGAAVIFGTTGGVMEAAVRTVAEILEGKEINQIEYEAVRGEEGVKEAELEIAGKKVKIAVVSGLGNARKLMEKVKNGEVDYHFIEVMACPGGCIMGGGQPRKILKERNGIDVKALRKNALYSEDKKATFRKSHQNPYVQKVYKEFLQEPGSHEAHKLFHTEYTKR